MKNIGMIQTVNGLIEKEDFGVTLVHEHLFINPTKVFLSGLLKPKEKTLRKLNAKEIKIVENELVVFKKNGGNSIVEVTPRHSRPITEEYKQISKNSGVNIVIGTGNYISKLLPKSVKKSDVETLAKEFIKDIEVGYKNTKVRAGIIGEIGCQYPLRVHEIKNLKAAAIASNSTGATITTHTGYNPKSPMEILEVLFSKNVNPKSIIIGHIENVFKPVQIDLIIEVLKKGVFIAFDNVGADQTIKLVPTKFKTSLQRAEVIAELVQKGYGDQILVSHDYLLNVCKEYKKGPGYKFAITTFVEMLKKCGLDDNQIHKILVDNPANALVFKTR